MSSIPKDRPIKVDRGKKATYNYTTPRALVQHLQEGTLLLRYCLGEQQKGAVRRLVGTSAPSTASRETIA
ncbi:uncharacterized protein V6R79_008342 [Siganus canaliculatus]